MEKPLSIVVTGPPTKDLLDASVRDSELSPFTTSFPLIDQLARGYCELGCSVVYVTSSERVCKPCKYPGSHEALTVVCVPRRKVQWCLLNLYREEVRNLIPAIQACKPDVVHALWTYEYADAALSSGLPTLVTAHDSPWRVAWLHRRPVRVVRALYSQLLVMPRIRHLSTVSPYMVRALRSNYFYHRPIELIPNGVPAAAFSGEPRQGVRNLHAPVIVGVSEWYPLKNPRMLLDAFSVVREQIPGARLLLFGHGFQPGGPAEHYAKSLGVTDGVAYLGYERPETIRRVLGEQADVFFHPTLEESFGMTFIEAMSLGIPCVGGRSSGAIPWVLGEGDSGLLVDVRNARSAADAILAVLRDPALFRKFAENGYLRAKSRYVIGQICEQYKRALLDLLEKEC